MMNFQDCKGRHGFMQRTLQLTNTDFPTFVLVYNKFGMNISILIPIMVGLIIGFATNYLADVLPITRKFTKPTCPHCGNEYHLREYLLFQKCSQCQHPRSSRAWITLLVPIIISLYLWDKSPVRLGYALSMVIILYFAVVFVIDLEHRLILHPTSVFGALLGLLAGWLNHGIGPTLWGGLGGFVIMLALYYFGVAFSKFRAWRMRKSGQPTDDEEALGAGDVILAGVLGLLLGWPLIWFGLLLGILLGGVIGVVVVLFLVLIRKYKENALMVFMAYGPFFILSAFFITFLPKLVSALLPK
jgi:leader peptidase (prepilin peptidase)/N-methyltransferase